MCFFSLVLCTLNRTTQVADLLKSVSQQTFRDFELIIVDQNHDNRLEEIVSRWDQHFNIKYLKTKPGLSRARNIGLRECEGRFVLFPDDDAELPVDSLHVISEVILRNQVDMLLGRLQDRTNGRDALKVWPNSALYVNSSMVWKTCSSATMVVSKELLVLPEVNGFDERFGLGARYGAEEDVDLALRLLHLGKKVYYCPQHMIYHPQGPLSINIEKLRGYCEGRGALVAKHLINYHNVIPLMIMIIDITKTLYGILYREVIQRQTPRFRWIKCRAIFAGFGRYMSMR